MSKTMKKIGTIFAAAALVGATLTGAIAADLKDMPAPFVKDGKADVAIVVGASAATADVLGAIDIASALQAKSVSTTAVSVPGASKSASVSDGVKVETSGNALLLGEALSTVMPGNVLDDSDLPELLADGIVTEEDDSDEFDYTQELALGTDIKVEFDSDDTDMDNPVLYLDLDTSADVLWTYSLEFTGGSALNLTTLEDSETIVMLGKTFTFDPNIDTTGTITLFGSDKTEYLTLNEPKTFTVDGKSYNVEVTGGNSDNDNVVIAVNGVSKTVTEGQTVTVNGLEIYAKDVFVTNIPTLSAAATLFIGSQEIVLPQASATANDYSEVEIGGETVNGLEAWVEAAGSFTPNGRVESINFRLKPSELSNDVAGFDEKNWLEAGEEVMDPLFGTFKVIFNGGNYALDDEDKGMFSLNGADDELTVKFVNDDGDEIAFTPLKLSGSNVVFEDTADGEGYNGAVQDGIWDGDVFVLEDSATNPRLTVVYEVTGFTSENNERVVRLKNLATGATDSYGASDKILGSYTVEEVNSTQFNLSSASVEQLYLKGGENFIDLGLLVAGNWLTQNITLNESDVDQVGTPSIFSFNVTKDSSDAELDVRVVGVTGTTDGAADDDNDFRYYVSQYGTYLIAEVDENDYVKGYVPGTEDNEVHYEVFIAPTDAVVSSVGGGSTVTTQVVNPIAVGAAVLDTSVNLASESKNLIVVGGPCANSVAAALMEVTSSNCGAGFTPGKAIIQLFDTPAKKVAMLIAGYEATETQAASRAVARMDSRLTGKSVTLTVTNTNDFTISATSAAPVVATPAANTTTTE